MSVRAMNWAIDTPTGDPGTKVVLIVLANYANEASQSYPSIQRLADETDQSVSSVKRRLNRLVEIGLIERSARGADDGGRQTNLYTLLTPAVREDRERVEGQIDPGGFGVKREGVRGQNRGGLGSPVNPEPSKNQRTREEETLVRSGNVVPIGKSAARSRGDEYESTPGFAKFWEGWPRKKNVSKATTLRAWQKHVIGARRDPDLIIAAAEIFARNELERVSGVEFIPHPTTWINQRRWETVDVQDAKVARRRDDHHERREPLPMAFNEGPAPEFTSDYLP